MKRLTSGALLLGAVLVAASCNNVTSDLAGGPTRITVDPNPQSFGRGKTATVLVQNFDDQGSPLISAATLAGAPTGPITLEIDTTYQPNGTHYGTQFLVKSTGFGVGFATFNDGGLTSTPDTIIVVPNDTNPTATLSAANPAPGDTVSFTVADPFRLDITGVMTVDSTVLQTVDISADSLTIRFIAPTAVPAHNGPVNMTKTAAQFGAAYPLLGSFVVSSSTNLVVP